MSKDILSVLYKKNTIFMHSIKYTLKREILVKQMLQWNNCNEIKCWSWAYLYAYQTLNISGIISF